jgi:SLOG in TRPM, prokaryote
MKINIMYEKLIFGRLIQHPADKQSLIWTRTEFFMRTRPEQPFSDRREINFSNGNHTQALLVPVGAQVDGMASALGIQAPRNAILIAGGASAMGKESDDELFPLLMNGIVRPATSLDALILYPGKTTDTNEDAVPLDPNHSHFILVKADTWGKETRTMYELVQFLSRGHASVAVLVNGGEIARKEALYNVRQGRPLIIIEGSGRAADEIARAMHDATFASSNAELTEIITKGDLLLFPFNGPAEELEQLILELLKRK